MPLRTALGLVTEQWHRHPMIMPELQVSVDGPALPHREETGEVLDDPASGSMDNRAAEPW